jgi:hypothetical protein
LPPGYVLESAPPPDIKINGRLLPRMIELTREQIAEVQREIAQVRAAPLKQSSQQEAVNRYLASQALRVRPRVGFDAQGNAKVLWNEDLLHSKDDLLGILFWIAPSSVSKAFSEMLSPEPEPEPDGALSPLEREQRISKFTNTLLTLERHEEYLIERAADEGTEITRRPDASPIAVLQLQIKEAADAAAA